MNMSDETKIKIISGLQTFGTSFIVAVATIVLDPNTVITWTYAFWGSLAIAGIRAAVKAILDSYIIPIRLGGKK